MEDILNINLQNFFNDSNILSNDRSVNGDISNQSELVNIKNTGEVSLRDLVTGDIFSGKIVDMNNYVVDILLDNDKHISATMQQALELNIGDKLLFQVKDKNDSQVFIKPLVNSNVSMELVTKSLIAANLNVNDKNTAIVKELVEKGQPIDKQSIMNLVRLTSKYGMENIDKIIDMTKNGIEISKENLQQYDLYVNGKHQISSNINEIQNNILTLLSEDAANVETKIEFIDKLSEAFDNNTNASVNTSRLPDIDKEIINSNSNVASDSSKGTNDFENKITDSNVTSENIVKGNAHVDKDGSKVLDIALNILKEAKTFKDINMAVKFVAENTSDKNIVKELMKLPEFSEKFKKIFNEKFYIDGENLEENKDKVKADLEKLYERFDKLSEVVKNNPETAKDSNLLASSDKLKNNLNFMNDLNNIESYVQIPVKFTEKQTNGELYVYNKKNKKFSENDNITAFLHLDMEYLGATDVNIAMEKNHLTTKFALDNESSRMLVEEHLSELIDKLENLGYSVNLSTELNVDKTEKNALLPITENNDKAVSIKRYTLDIKT